MKRQINYQHSLEQDSFWHMYARFGLENLNVLCTRVSEDDICTVALTCTSLNRAYADWYASHKARCMKRFGEQLVAQISTFSFGAQLLSFVDQFDAALAGDFVLYHAVDRSIISPSKQQFTIKVYIPRIGPYSYSSARMMAALYFNIKMPQIDSWRRTVLESEDVAFEDVKYKEQFERYIKYFEFGSKLSQRDVHSLTRFRASGERSVPYYLSTLDTEYLLDVGKSEEMRTVRLKLVFTGYDDVGQYVRERKRLSVERVYYTAGKFHCDEYWHTRRALITVNECTSGEEKLELRRVAHYTQNCFKLA